MDSLEAILFGPSDETGLNRRVAAPGQQGGQGRAPKLERGRRTSGLQSWGLEGEGEVIDNGGLKPNQFEPLNRALYEPSASEVAPALLGHWLVRRTPRGVCGGVIVETEAYLINDPACHGAPGPTARNRVMFGAPGHAYVYFIYGCHFCVNAVCCRAGVAEALLIRAIEPVFGLQWMRAQRTVARERDLTNGPAKLCEAMDIDRRLNGADLCDPRSRLFVAENPDETRFRKQRGPMVTTTRIGITQAAELPLRFYLAASPFVSRLELRASARRVNSRV